MRNQNYPDGDPKAERWNASFTSKTRVRPTLGWVMASVRQNLRRTITRKFGVESEEKNEAV